jgi:hypothetical protein
MTRIKFADSVSQRHRTDDDIDGSCAASDPGRARAGPTDGPGQRILSSPHLLLAFSEAARGCSS